jgi:hypothetical protein
MLPGDFSQDQRCVSRGARAVSDYANRKRDVGEFYCRADVWRLSQPYQLLSDTEQIFSDRMAGKADRLEDFNFIQAEFA